MPHSGENIRFQVLVNGKARKVIGIESIGVVSILVDWIHRDPAKYPGRIRKPSSVRMKNWTDCKNRLVLAGLDAKSKEHLDWLSRALQVGDEVTVRVLPPGEFDRPRRCPREARNKT